MRYNSAIGFLAWALANVHSFILTICADAQFTAVIEATKPNVLRRLRAFGPQLIASRTAITGFNNLIKACPEIHIAEIHKCCTETALTGSRDLTADLSEPTRFEPVQIFNGDQDIDNHVEKNQDGNKNNSGG
ncbi:hypothetical protein Ct61P_15116 [Colletotrichum tofieldiae]|nr:hypothetical protein Ct61P_15116 [Colletotrichum tofieldiae]